jgi:hypothetical protein
MPHRHARTLNWGRLRVGPTSVSSCPRSPEGDQFHTDPDDEGSRRPFTTGAGPASPERLLVYPWRNGEIVGRGFGGVDEVKRIFSFAMRGNDRTMRAQSNDISMLGGAGRCEKMAQEKNPPLCFPPVSAEDDGISGRAKGSRIRARWKGTRWAHCEGC